MGDVVDLKTKRKQKVRNIVEKGLDKLLTALYKFNIENEGKILDKDLHRRIVKARSKGWSFIHYYGLLARDKETLEKEGIKVQDLGLAYKIIFPKE